MQALQERANRGETEAITELSDFAIGPCGIPNNFAKQLDKNLNRISENNSYRKVVEGAHDAPLPMALPLLLLSIGSIFVGYLGKDMIGFYSGDASSVETILNASNIDYMDIVEVEI